MKFFVKLKIIVLACFAATAGAQENISETDLINSTQLCHKNFSHKKKFFYGSISPIFGAGLSLRNRTGKTGSAVDFKVGVIDLGILSLDYYSMQLFPVISGDYNFLYYMRKKEVSPYFSWGLGAAYILPYLPLRAGVEFKQGFVDIGLKLFYPYIPLPEIRLGFGKEF